MNFPISFRLLLNYSHTAYENIIQNDNARTIARLNLSNISNNVIGHFCEDQIIPSWSSFNSVISNRSLGVQQGGFMPVLPHPVTKICNSIYISTKYVTIYTSLLNM